MAILIETRPDVTEREQIWHMKEQLEAYLNAYEGFTLEDIDRLIKSGAVTSGGSSGGGGGGGGGTVTSYLNLSDKPSIEGVVLQGNRDLEDLNILGLTNTEIENLLNSNDINIEEE